MKSRYASLLLQIVCISTSGCTPARRLGSMVGYAALAVPVIVADGLVNGLLDNDESPSEKLAREDRDEAWKGYW